MKEKGHNKLHSNKLHDSLDCWSAVPSISSKILYSPGTKVVGLRTMASFSSSNTHILSVVSSTDPM